MTVITITKNVSNVTVTKQAVKKIRILPYNIPSGIAADTLTEAGSMIVATGASTPSETGAPTADGLAWVSDLSQAKKGRWQALSFSGGDVSLVNKSGVLQEAGTVVIPDYTADYGFTTTDIEGDSRVVGVLSEDIANNASGKVGVGKKTSTVKVTGNVARGEWLITSSTAGMAKASGTTRPPGAIGVAMTAYEGGGNGTVVALLNIEEQGIVDATSGVVSITTDEVVVQDFYIPGWEMRTAQYKTDFYAYFPGTTARTLTLRLKTAGKTTSLAFSLGLNKYYVAHFMLTFCASDSANYQDWYYDCEVWNATDSTTLSSQKYLSYHHNESESAPIRLTVTLQLSTASGQGWVQSAHTQKISNI